MSTRKVVGARSQGEGSKTSRMELEGGLMLWRENNTAREFAEYVRGRKKEEGD
jgi:hypothetical protein